MSEAQLVVSVQLRRADGAIVGISLPWVAGKTVRQYLRHPQLRSHGTISLAKKSRMVDQAGKKLRLRSILPAGGYIFFVNPITRLL